MFTDDLLERVLVEPARKGADKLYIVSGYASATMASRHIEILNGLKKQINIELIVGMCPNDGLSQKDHEGFQGLVARPSGGRFVCRYVAYNPPVHAKVYAWCKGSDPVVAFSGSANYTQPSFTGPRRETMTPHSAGEGLSFYDLVLQDTVECTDARVPSLIEVYEEPFYTLRRRTEEETEEAGASVSLPDELNKLQQVSINLLDNRGQLPERSGLNWGQRPEYNREPNQAYIRIPLSIAKTDFFPSIGEHFTILTDDGKSLICVRAQQGGKAIHTTHNNSLLGEYFRYRLGMSSGSPITREDLTTYGRTGVDFYKIDDETYWMDFSSN
ncbi:restriction endonuclease PLD domain-containing protein [Chloroflexota bacterium]